MAEHADVRALSARALVEAPAPPARVRAYSARVLVAAPLPPAEVRALSVRVLVGPDVLPSPGMYVKGDDGQWHPLATWGWE